MPFDPSRLMLYPSEPGVYLMKNASRQVLYIGKAKNLRTRLKQYYAVDGDMRKMIPYLTAQIETIDTIITLTEKDALILENNLIKQHQPKYNVLLKDDKTFISLGILRHAWPMIKLIRFKGKPPKGIDLVFGPYTSALAARQTFDLISRLFPLRQCSNEEFANRTRPCLLYDIKKCIAPCVEKCSKEEYQMYLDGAIRLLKGQDKDVLRLLQQKMKEASDALEFEKARDYHHTIEQIKHVTQIQHVDHLEAKDCDVVCIYRKEDAACISLLCFRNGKIISSEHFSFHLIASDDSQALESFLLQYYKDRSLIPAEILISSKLPERAAIEEILSKSKGRSLSVLTPERGKKKELIEMGLKNAKALLTREQDSRSFKEKMLLDLQDACQLTRFPRRIECFDTSNLSGTDPVASLACFVNAEKDPSRTRLFRIQGLDQSHDYAALKQVLHRHFTREKEKNDFCDLVIIDGGKGHLKIASDVFEMLGIASVDLIAIAKEDARHDRGLTREKIYLPHHLDPIRMDPRSPLLFLLQRIRDEAHRLAISYHKKTRSKRTLTSALDEIEGIGPVKKNRLLRHFGSVENIRKASRKQLEAVKGLQKRDIEHLLKWSNIS